MAEVDFLKKNSQNQAVNHVKVSTPSKDFNMTLVSSVKKQLGEDRYQPPYIGAGDDGRDTETMSEDCCFRKLIGWELPGGPVVRTQWFHCNGRFQSLVGELRSCKLCSRAKKKEFYVCVYIGIT